MSSQRFDTPARDIRRDFKVITVTIDATVNTDDTVFFNLREVLGRSARKIIFLTTDPSDSITFEVNPYVKVRKPHADRVDETIYLRNDSSEAFTMTVADSGMGGLVDRPEIVWDLCQVNNLAITDATVGGVTTTDLAPLTTVDILVA